MYLYRVRCRYDVVPCNVILRYMGPRHNGTALYFADIILSMIF